MKQSNTIEFFFLFLTIYFLKASSPDFSYYHTTDEIYQKISYLESNCNNMLKIKVINEEPLIHLLDINQNISSSQIEKHKAFLLFGEHAREMISPEAGISLLERFCSNDVEPNSMVSKLLEKYHLQMILNANPASRKNVEQGDYCLRVNENGIDLNRNWDSHWKKSGDSFSQTNSGDFAFSEIETQVIKESLERFIPKVFLTVHSGAMGMYTPYAYSNEKGIFNENKMMSVLSQLNPNHCKCSTGSAGKEVGYLCPGTCLDYAYDKLKVPYVFAWEIYEKGFDFKKLLVELNMKFLQINNKNGKNRNMEHDSIKKSMFSCFSQTSSSTMNGLSAEECFDYFNPSTEERYNMVVKNWVNAMLEMLEKVDEQER